MVETEVKPENRDLGDWKIRTDLFSSRISAQWNRREFCGAQMKKGSKHESLDPLFLLYGAGNGIRRPPKAKWQFEYST